MACHSPIALKALNQAIMPAQYLSEEPASLFTSLPVKN